MTLKRNTPLSRGGRIKPSNARRRKETFDRNFGERGAAVREMDCLCAQVLRDWSDSSTMEVPPKYWCRGSVQAAHAIARGMGGRGGTKRDLVPLCAGHHDEAGERRGSQREDFEGRYELNLEAESLRVALELDGLGLS